MRIFTILIIFCTFLTVTHAQQEAQYTQYMFNNMQNNAGFTGARRVASFNALYRNQWIGFKGNPRSIFASFDMPLPDMNRLGVGMMVSNQSEGIINRVAVTPSVSYAVIHTDESTLRVGINASLRQYRFDLQSPNVNIRERQDPTLSETDRINFNNMNIGFGVYYDRKNIFAGLSIPNLNENPLVLNPKASAVTLQGKERKHIYAMIGGLFPLMGGDIQVKPSIQLKYVANAPLSADATVNVWFKRKFMGGLAYRFGSSGSGDSVDFLTLVQVSNSFSVGMAYDFGLSQIGTYNRSSIEAAVRYDISVAPKDMHNPRFFF